MQKYQFNVIKDINQEIMEQLNYNQQYFATQIKIEKLQQKNFQLRLIPNFLLIYLKKENISTPIKYLQLSPQIRFQKIVDIDFMCSNHKISKNIIKGFKLQNQRKQSISIYLQEKQKVLHCIEILKKYLNQLGFHKYFRPLRTLGQGSSACVYQIIRKQDNIKFAAKGFPKDVINSTVQHQQRFINELTILRNIQHENILKIEGVYESQNSYYVVMQTLNGGNMFQYLTKLKTSVQIQQIKRIMWHLMKGLSYLASQQIIHRDIKLQNFMFKQSNSIPLIVDFGLAVYQNDDDYIYYNCGTPGYLSPQAFALKKGDKLTPLSDVFSAGVIFHVLLTGKYLFEGRDPQTILLNNKNMNFDLNKQMYKGLDQSALNLLKKMLERDVQNRISALQCLNHRFLRQMKAQQQKIPVTPAATEDNYQF